MATSWLDRLSSAMTYAELQDVFTSIAAEAKDADDPRALAAALDEAVLRIEGERARDEEELRAFEAEYEAFKESQSGALGWLRRHLPFTATRRREKEHQDVLADQRAEILGDVMVIARAEMLREHLLTPSERETGLEADAWRKLLTADEAPDRLRDYAHTVRALGAARTRSRAFLEHITNDIEAFADASFRDKEERMRQAADVAAARHELACFQERTAAVEALRGEAMTHIGGSVSADLAAKGGSYPRLSRRIPRLEGALEQARAAEGCLADLEESVATLVELERRVAEQPEQRRQLAAKLTESRNAAQDARARQAEAQDALALKESEYQRAVEAETAARAEVRRAQDELSELLERTGQFELEPGQSLGDATPADAHLTQAQAELQRTHAQVRSLADPYESARASAARAEKGARAAEAECADIERKLRGMDERAERLQGDIERARVEIRPTLDRLPEVVSRYHAALDDLDQRSSLPRDRDGLRPRARFEVQGFDDAAKDADDLERATALWKRLSETLADEERTLVRGLAEAREQQAALWTEHAETLLGKELAAELSAPE